MNILVTFGTRPEAIKLFSGDPRISRRERDFNVTVCVTAQHREMLDQVIDTSARARYRARSRSRTSCGRTNHLPEMTSRIIRGFDEVLAEVAPDRVDGAGRHDDSDGRCFVGILSQDPGRPCRGGLRSGDNYSPWPEEVNRKVVGSIASLHFAPTARAAESLMRRMFRGSGYSSPATLLSMRFLQTKQRIEQQPRAPKLCQPCNCLMRVTTGASSLLTAHRRENFDGGMERIAAALLKIVEREDVIAVFPVHPNPNVMGPMRAMLGNPPAHPAFAAAGLRAVCSSAVPELPGADGFRRRPGRSAGPGQAGAGHARHNRTPRRREAGTALLVGTDPS